METYDLIMFAVLALATLRGAWKGLAWQIASLSSIFVSFFLAVRLRGPVSAVLPASPPWNRFLAMLLIYLSCSLVIWLAFRFVSQLIERIRLKEFDRQTGAMLGLARGLLWCVLITLFGMTLLGESQQEAIIRSRSGYYLARLLDHARPVMPAELQDVLAPYLHTLDERLPAESRTWGADRDDGSASGDNTAGDAWSSPVGGDGERAGEDAIDRWLRQRPAVP